MKQKRLLLIVNPISGTKSKTVLVPRIEQKLADMGMLVTTHFTRGPGDATAIAAEAVAARYDAVAVCGGDGTVNEAACGLCGTSMPMAIIPSGSGNGLARHIGLGADEMASLRIIDDAAVRDCDYAVANGRKYFCTLGMGFDAAVAVKFAAESRRGLATYLKDACTEFVRYKPKDYTITIDGDTVIERKAYLVACCNASQYGNNAFIAPRASITDGYLDVVILREASHVQTLLAGLDMLTGMLPHNHQVETFRARTVDIHVHEPIPAHIDGEPVVDIGTDVHVEIVPAQLRLFTNFTKEAVTPFITPAEYMARDFTAAISRIFH